MTRWTWVSCSGPMERLLGWLRGQVPAGLCFLLSQEAPARCGSGGFS